MSMKARVITDALGNITVVMEGGLDFENSLPLRKELETMTKNNPTCDVTIDMHALDFVGSSGINYFVETLQSLEKSVNVRLSNVKAEFLRVFKLYGYDAYAKCIIEEFDTEQAEAAITTTPKKSLYQN
jgi:anti-sigma B factor antagonist